MFDIWRIASFLKKSFNKKDLIFMLLIVGVYFATRLINLEQFPIFTDEGIYIRWAKVAHEDPTWRFISLTDGKQVLQTWATIPLLKLFPENPIFAGRLFAVLSGFSGMVGVFTLLFYLFNKRAAFWGAFFYLFTPYFLFYDRMALVDSAVNSSFVWILFFSILLVRTVRFDVALMYGLGAGIASLGKSSIRLFVGLSALAPLLTFTKTRQAFRKTVNFYILYALVVVLSFVVYNVQRLSPFLHFVAEKNKTFVMTFPEFLQNPFQYVFHNLIIIPQYLLNESALVLPVFAIVGTYLLFKKSWRVATYLVLWFLLPFTIIAFFAKIIFPRYLIFFATLFIVPATYFITNVKRKNIFLGALALYLLSVLYFDHTILFQHTKIPFPEIDRGQYIEGVPAGFGLHELVGYARAKSKEKPVILLAEGNFGVVGDMLEASLKKSDKPGINIKGYWPLEKKDLEENFALLKTHHVFAVFPHRTTFPEDWPLKLVKKYEKPGGISAFYLMELVRK